MPEFVTLTVPPPQLTTYKVNELYLNWDAAKIEIGLKGTNGESKHHTYSSTTATAFMTVLNSKNFSSTSLHKEIIKRLISDGVIAGTISGTPE